MGNVTVDKDEGGTGKRESGNSWGHSHDSHAQHRRSKSSSDRNSDVSRGVSPSIRADLNGSHDLATSTRTCGARRSNLQEHINNGLSTISSSNHRASLENDIDRLQLRLQQEKSMRVMLERAMGRASSTLSPGHRHFAAQTKELIAEIEVLEEEVTNREQHVLTLYRSMFEHCVSRSSSEQNSGISSPARKKNEARKHPSIISSAFCSSKKFPLRSFQALASINHSGKRTLSSQSGSKHASLLSGKNNIQMEKTCSDYSNKATVEKTCVMKTLKDHLCQCPSKLSEEMVKCMAVVYCWLRGATSENPENDRSPSLSKSSTNVTLPRHGIEGDQDWSSKSMVEISSISADKNQFSCASYTFNDYRVLVEQLTRVNVRQMESNAQTAFWINVYNSLIMHAYLAYGIPQNSLRRLALFHKAAYNVGGHVTSANAIEQSIFSLRTPRNGRWLETILSTAMRKKFGEERQRQLICSEFGLPRPIPLLCFALCTGAFSDPVLRVYTASNVKEELEVAKREFLQANVVVKKSGKVFLPKVLERFVREASISSGDILKWVIEDVDGKLRDSIQKCIDRKTNRKTSQITEWLPYNSTFRYVFSKDLTQRPWRV